MLFVKFQTPQENTSTRNTMFSIFVDATPASEFNFKQSDTRTIISHNKNGYCRTVMQSGESLYVKITSLKKTVN